MLMEIPENEITREFGQTVTNIGEIKNMLLPKLNM